MSNPHQCKIHQNLAVSRLGLPHMQRHSPPLLASVWRLRLCRHRCRLLFWNTAGRHEDKQRGFGSADILWLCGVDDTAGLAIWKVPAVET